MKMTTEAAYGDIDVRYGFLIIGHVDLFGLRVQNLESDGPWQEKECHEEGDKHANSECDSEVQFPGWR